MCTFSRARSCSIPRRSRFSPGPELRTGRYKLGGGAAALSDGRVAVWGGGPGVELIDVEAGTTSPLPDSPQGVASFGTVTVVGDRLILIGGYDERIRLSRTFEVLREPE